MTGQVKIISRIADTDVEATLTAQAMQSAGADVFSVTYHGSSLMPPGVVSSKFIVWAKYNSESIGVDLIDAAIGERISEIYGGTME